MDGSGGDNDAELALVSQVKQATADDQLTDIASLYLNAIKLLKHLREPGMIRHVETRREYQLNVTQLDYGYIELKSSEGFYLEFHKDHKYTITSVNQGYRFVGRFNPDGLTDIKIPQKWAHIDDWQLETSAVEVSFIDEYFSNIDVHNINNTGQGVATS